MTQQLHAGIVHVFGKYRGEAVFDARRHGFELRPSDLVELDTFTPSCLSSRYGSEPGYLASLLRLRQAEPMWDCVSP